MYSSNDFNDLERGRIWSVVALALLLLLMGYIVGRLTAPQPKPNPSPHSATFIPHSLEKNKL